MQVLCWDRQYCDNRMFISPIIFDPFFSRCRGYIIQTHAEDSLENINYRERIFGKYVDDFRRSQCSMLQITDILTC